MKVTIDNLLGAENILKAAQARGNIPTNYAIDRNLERVTDALKPFRDEMKREPMCWHFWIDKSEKPNVKKDEDKDKHEEKGPTDEQRKEGLDALEEYLKHDVDFRPYTLSLDRCSDELRPLSNARERLDDDGLQHLNEDFFITLKVLGILKEEG